jgi:hypothetical protein
MTTGTELSNSNVKLWRLFINLHYHDTFVERLIKVTKEKRNFNEIRTHPFKPENRRRAKLTCP